MILRQTCTRTVLVMQLFGKISTWLVILVLMVLGMSQIKLQLSLINKALVLTMLLVEFMRMPLRVSPAKLGMMVGYTLLPRLLAS